MTLRQRRVPRASQTAARPDFFVWTGPSAGWLPAAIVVAAGGPLPAEAPTATGRQIDEA